jgi:hypothetical protein
MNNIRNIYKLARVLSLSLFVMASCSDDDNDAQPAVKSSAKSIASVSFLGLDPKVAGFVGENSKVVSVIVPAGTDVTALVPNIVISDKATIAPASGAKQDFSNPVTYTVTAEDDTEQKYTVSVSKGGITIKSLGAEQVDQGQALTIYGDGFSNAENTIKLVGDWGFVTLDITAESAAKIDVIMADWVPAGRYYIVAENADGQSFMYPETLTVGHPVSVTSVNKTSARSGEEIVFTGENFNDEDVQYIEVQFYGEGDAYWVDYYSSVSEDGTRLTATVPEGVPPGAYTVTVVVGFDAVYTTDFHVIEGD